MKCSKCHETFATKSDLEFHVENCQPSTNYMCDICKTKFTEQFKFFEHLKAHYESASLPTISDYEAASILIDASNSGPVQMTGGLSIHASHVDLLSEEDGTKPSRIPTMEKKTEQVQDNPATITSADLMPSTSAGVVGSAAMTFADDSPDKVLLTCPKCKRTFRREKTFQIHVNGTICGSEYRASVDGHENGDHDRVKVKGKKGKLKQEVVMVCKDEPPQNDLEDEIQDVAEMDANLGDDDPMEFEDDEEEDCILGDGNMCPGCEEVFPSRGKLEVHLKKAHPDLASSPNGKGSKKKKGIGQRRQEVLKCSECNRIFNHRNSLVYHMRSHTGERPHQCEMCGKSFFATSALKVHMRLHSGEKPYKCDHCGRHFRQWGDLKYHVISIHSDIRQYQCEFCGKDFARKYSLIVHRRIHTGERNYKCDFCAKCFRAASYLQNHRRIHTGEKPHACNICGKPFRVRSDMKRHMASHNRDHGPNHAANNNPINVSVAAALNNLQTPNSLLQPTVVTVGNNNSQLLAVGPHMSSQIVHTVRSGQAIQVPGSTTTQMIQQHSALDDSNEDVISGDIPEGTPINIILSHDPCTNEDGSLDAATVAALQAGELPEGVIYQSRDGQMEAVTIRESTTGGFSFSVTQTTFEDGRGKFQ